MSWLPKRFAIAQHNTKSIRPIRLSRTAITTERLSFVQRFLQFVLQAVSSQCENVFIAYAKQLFPWRPINLFKQSQFFGTLELPICPLGGLGADIDFFMGAFWGPLGRSWAENYSFNYVSLTCSKTKCFILINQWFCAPKGSPGLDNYSLAYLIRNVFLKPFRFIQ